MNYCSGCKTNFLDRTAYGLHRNGSRCLSQTEMYRTGLFDLSYPIVRLLDTAVGRSEGTERPVKPLFTAAGQPEGFSESRQVARNPLPQSASAQP